jgi:AraC-like DNA-binding protein
MRAPRPGVALLTLAHDAERSVRLPPSATHGDALEDRSFPVSSSSALGQLELIKALLSEALTLLDQDQASARRCIEGARSLIRAPDNEDRPRNCLLADWQLRRAKEFILENLATCLRIEVVAKHVHLSASYFSRAFKATAGVSYSSFLANARIDLAKQLLLTTDVPISEVALACGLADQSHLTRLFGRVVGLPPNTWRRQVLGAGS